MEAPILLQNRALFCIGGTLFITHFVHNNVFAYGRGLVHDVNPTNAAVPPMHVLESSSLFLVFSPESEVVTTVTRVVSDLSHTLMFEARFLRGHQSAIILAPEEDFRPNPT